MSPGTVTGNLHSQDSLQVEFYADCSTMWMVEPVDSLLQHCHPSQQGLYPAEELQHLTMFAVLQLPNALRLEPMRLASGGVLTLPAGSGLPETTVSVMNGAGNKVVKALIGGQRQQLKVVSNLHSLSMPSKQQLLLIVLV